MTECPKCLKVFTTKYNCSRHINSNSCVQAIFYCETCNKKFTDKYNMLRHGKTHIIDQEVEINEGNLIPFTEPDICKYLIKCRSDLKKQKIFGIIEKRIEELFEKNNTNELLGYIIDSIHNNSNLPELRNLFVKKIDDEYIYVAYTGDAWVEVDYATEVMSVAKTDAISIINIIDWDQDSKKCQECRESLCSKKSKPSHHEKSEENLANFALSKNHSNIKIKDRKKHPNYRVKHLYKAEIIENAIKNNTYGEYLEKERLEKERVLEEARIIAEKKQRKREKKLKKLKKLKKNDEDPKSNGIGLPFLMLLCEDDEYEPSIEDEAFFNKLFDKHIEKIKKAPEFVSDKIKESKKVKNQKKNKK